MPSGSYFAEGEVITSTWLIIDDGILSIYHDQGLTPFKSLSFSEGVNYTAGLPIIRTSPVHGTGYDIAGKNIANANSFRESIYLSCQSNKLRKEYFNLKSNSLAK